MRMNIFDDETNRYMQFYGLEIKCENDIYVFYANNKKITSGFNPDEIEIYKDEKGLVCGVYNLPKGVLEYGNGNEFVFVYSIYKKKLTQYRVKNHFFKGFDKPMVVTEKGLKIINIGSAWEVIDSSSSSVYINVLPDGILKVPNPKGIRANEIILYNKEGVFVESYSLDMYDEDDEEIYDLTINKIMSSLKRKYIAANIYYSLKIWPEKWRFDDIYHESEKYFNINEESAFSMDNIFECINLNDSLFKNKGAIQDLQDFFDMLIKLGYSSSENIENVLLKFMNLNQRCFDIDGLFPNGLLNSVLRRVIAEWESYNEDEFEDDEELEENEEEILSEIENQYTTRNFINLTDDEYLENKLSREDGIFLKNLCSSELFRRRSDLFGNYVGLICIKKDKKYNFSKICSLDFGEIHNGVIYPNNDIASDIDMSKFEAVVLYCYDVEMGKYYMIAKSLDKTNITEEELRVIENGMQGFHCSDERKAEILIDKLPDKLHPYVDLFDIYYK